MQVDGLGVERVEAVAQRSAGGGHGQERIEQRCRVVSQDTPRSAVAGRVDPLGTALGKAEKQRHEHAGEQQPAGRRNADAGGARKNPQHEPGGDAEDVHHRLVLERQRVADVDRKIDADQEQDARAGGQRGGRGRRERGDGEEKAKREDHQTFHYWTRQSLLTHQYSGATPRVRSFTAKESKTPETQGSLMITKMGDFRRHRQSPNPTCHRYVS